MYEKIDADLIEAGKQLELCRGRDVEGLVRPTTDRTRFTLSLEVLAAIIAAIRQILASRGSCQPSLPGSDGADGSGA